MAAAAAKGRAKGGGAGPGNGDPNRAVARNRKARHDYEIIETHEAGIRLLGSEVKSLRAGRASLSEAYARVEGRDVVLHGLHIPPYEFARGGGHEPRRPRPLLLKRAEVAHLAQRVNEAGLTLVPLAVYFTHGLAKVEIALARGRKHHDKRQATASREAQREMERVQGRRAKGM